MNELRITTATGVDYEDGKWLVSYQTIIPSSIVSGIGVVSGGTNQPGIHVFSVKAETFNKAKFLSNLETSRRVYVGHDKVIVIGRKAAENGITQLVDSYLRGTEERATVYLMVIESKASDLLKKLVPPEKLPGQSYSEILEKETRLVSAFPKKSVFQFALSLYSDSRSIGIPVVSLIGRERNDSAKNLESIDALKSTAPELKLTLSKLAIFRDDRLVGFLNRKESRGLSWLTDQIIETEMTFPCSAGSKQLSSVLVYASSTNVKPTKTGNGFAMRVRIKANGDLMESTCTEDLSNPQVISALEQTLEAQIADDVNAAWRALQRLGADTAGFADKIHRKFPHDWRRVKTDWEREFKKIQLNVEVKAIIRRPGLIQNSANRRQLD
ncbi:Ger(x)C family spore germination protein [Paenibacillus thailandensis]|uniref:Ger(X)C family spore germination protein n=1 Tax=Paenibacillus thailandensis TaxID=393250 RepID=A0ABW5QUA8_9BACL